VDVVVGLGSNLGDRRFELARALEGLAALGTVLGVSRVYETPPLGPPQPDYLNAAVRLETTLAPLALLDALRAIERAAGRERGERWGARTLDLDVLWIDGLSVYSKQLCVPHPQLTRRAFALAPLLDVAPEATDPRTGARYRELLDALDAASLRPTDSPLQQR